MPLLDPGENIQFGSTLNVDKIIRVFTGSYVASDLTTRVGSLSTAYIYTIPHGLTRPVACDIMTSTDAGETWDMGIGKLAFSDSTNIYIFHGYSASGPVEYKIYCSWITDYDDTNPLIDTELYTTQNIQFDSRINYQKLYSEGELSFTAGTFGASETNTVTHDLDYQPNAKIYFEAFEGEVWPMNFGGAKNFYTYDGSRDECSTEIYDDRIDVTLFKFSDAIRRAWYRIYYDSN